MSVRNQIACISAILLVFTAAGSGIDFHPHEYGGDGEPRPASRPNPPGANVGPDPQLIWRQSPTIDSMTLFNSTEVADINLDGCLDIVSTGGNTGIKIWLGDGANHWNQTASPISTGVFLDVAVGDLNNDGAMDIVGARSSGLFAWCKNKTTGGWNSVSGGLPPTRSNKCVILADINNDGNLDIVASGSAGGPNKAVSVYKGNGRGAWSIADNGMPPTGTYFSVAAVDLNKDGNLDIAGAYNNGVDAWTGDGRGNWTRRNSGLPGPPEAGSYSAVDFCDFNLDGNMDIVGTSSGNSGIWICTGDGTGVWTPHRLGLPTTGSYSGVRAADVNLDGYPDVLASSTSNNQTVWTGDGNFGWYMQTTGLPMLTPLRGISIGDLDRDGRLDFCGPSMTGGIAAWDSAVERRVNQWTEYSAPSTGATINDIAALDINLDGRLDVCYATQSNGIQIFGGDGAGNWTAFASPTSAGTYYSVKSCDFNRDGKPDLVAVSSNGIQSWIGYGNGTWWTSMPSGLPGPPDGGAWLSLAVEDINDDGKVDIVAGSGQGSGLMVFSGSGTGVWKVKLGLPLSANFHDIAVGDVNRDGKSDLVLASSTGVRCYLGNGAFNWTQASVGLPLSANYRNVELADVNRDGALDVVAASSGAEGANTWLGDGSGTWSEEDQVSPFAVRGLSLGDVDLDGVLDVVVGSNGSANGISCQAQQSDGWSPLSSGLPVTDDYGVLRLADINIDGRLDIIASNGTSTGSRIWVADYVAPPAPWFNITVVAGWNLVSVPLLSDNETLPFAIMDKVNGGAGLVQWDRAMWRNPSSPNDPWKQYNSAWPSAMNDLKTLQPAMGIWLHVTNVGDGMICVGGAGYSDCSDTSVQLRTGWNLIGYPSSEAGATIADLKMQCPSVDAVEAFNEAAIYKTWTPPGSYQLKRGEGYWVHAAADTVWNIP
jgi:hypothetical protein